MHVRLRRNTSRNFHMHSHNNIIILLLSLMGVYLCYGLSLNKARRHDNGDCASTLLLQDTTGHHMWHQCRMIGGRIVADKTRSRSVAWCGQ